MCGESGWCESKNINIGKKKRLCPKSNRSTEKSIEAAHSDVEKRKYKKKMKKSSEEQKTRSNGGQQTMKKQKKKQDCHQISEGQTEARTQIATFMGDTDEDMGTAEIEEEDWIEDMKRSTRLAEEKMRAANVPCWIETHKKMK